MPCLLMVSPHGLAGFVLFLVQMEESCFERTGNGNNDAHVSGLSTILVATIQETKDKIAQIEYLFCRQLYPDFQAKSKSLMKMYADAKQEAEQTWKESEKNLLLQIKTLQSDRQEALGENKLLRLRSDELLEMQKKAERQENRVSDLEQKLTNKWKEIDEGLKMQNKLIQLVQAKSRLIAEKEKQLKEREEAATAQHARLKDMEQEMTELKLTLMHTTAKLKSSEEDKCSNLQEAEREEGRAPSQAHLVQRLEESERMRNNLESKMKLKDSELLMQAKKKGEIINAYKRLKSQYNFLCSKLDLSKESTHLKKKAIVAAPEASKIEIEKEKKIEEATCNSEDKAVVRPIPSPFTIFRRHPSPSAKSVSVIGAKRTSSWIETKSNEQDEFLDAPMNSSRECSRKDAEEKTEDQPDPARHASASSSVEKETDGREIAIPGGDGFKYVEPVRKKADRENLKGVECKQCKKFYDAVLPNRDEQSYRCEHLDDVSRHRYKHLPPMTPEGFWDIGFETEI